MLVLAAGWHAAKRRPALSDSGPTISVLVPAFNEGRVLEGTVGSALRSRYRALEILVVDDGSSDDTRAVAERLAARHPAVRLIALAENQGKAAALNAGIAASRADVVVTVDADTILDPDALGAFAAVLRDPTISAVAGNISVGNRDSALTVWQSLEYVTGIQLERRALHVLGCITTLPGAASAVRREALLAVGGVSGRTVTEDTDLAISLLRAGYRIAFEPRARAFTEAPDTWRSLRGQRVRWSTGFLQCLWAHRSGFFRGGAVGWIGLPNLLYAHLISYLAVPLVLSGLVGLVARADGIGLLWFYVGLVGLDLAVTACAYALDRQPGRDLLWAPVWRPVWPLFLTWVFLRVLALVAMRRRLIWERVPRQGQLAERSLRA